MATVRVQPKLVLRHQDRSTKWSSTVRVLNHCFPHLVSAVSFGLGAATTRHRAALNVTAGRRYRPPSRDPYEGINSNDPRVVTRTLHSVLRAAKLAAGNDATPRAHQSNGTYDYSPLQAPPRLVLYSHRLAHLGHHIDRYHSVWRELMAVSSASPHCCRLTSNPDEVVFYYRGFTTEMTQRGVALGCEEVEPRTLARVLDEYHPANTTLCRKIAIVSRYANVNAVMQPFVQTLTHHGWTVRVIQQTAAQDFCFLQAARFHLIGMYRSTFFQWAALLGTSSDTNTMNTTPRRVTVYSMNTPGRQTWAQRRNRTTVLESYNFSNPIVRQQYEFRLWNP